MSQAVRIRWNTLFIFLSTFIRLSTNFLLFVGIARIYGPETFGQFTTAHTLATIFILFADFGFDSLLVTEISRQREKAGEIAGRYFSFKLLFASAAAIVMLFVPIFQQSSEATKIFIWIFSSYVFFSVINTFFFALFKGFEQLYHETKISFIINLLLLGGLILAQYAHMPAYGIAVMFVASRILGVLLALRFMVGKLQIQSFHLTFKGGRETLRRVLVFGLQFIFGNLFFTLDTILLSSWRGDHEVGIYQSVFKLAVLALMIPDILINTMLPVLARLHNEEKSQWDKIGYLLNKTLFLSSLPIVAVLFVYADQVIGIVYGADAFMEAVPILRIFSIIVFIRFSVEASALMITTSFHQSRRLVIVVGGTEVNCLLNYYMIPRYGIWGAAAISLVTNAIVGIAYLVVSGAFWRRWFTDLRSIIPLGIMGCLSIVLWQIRTISIFYTVPFVIALYAFVFYYIGYSKGERTLLFARARILGQ
ncbi:MAG: flippase [bacterium]